LAAGPTTAQRVEARINRELPPGTPYPTVERWLSARGIEHFACASTEDCWDPPATGLNSADLGGIIEALKPDPTRSKAQGESQRCDLGSLGGRSTRSIWGI
jgi:hypothetical protein